MITLSFLFWKSKMSKKSPFDYSPIHHVMNILSLPSSLYPQAEALYEKSFPEEERRDSHEWHDYWLNKEGFSIHAILTNGDVFAGFISYWQFDDFIYVEHFALSPTLRGNGIGGKVLEHFISQFQTRPILLEVEEPCNEIAARRIAFYKRHHFTLLPNPYLQPPYRPGGLSVPLHIMCTMPQVVISKYDQFVSVLQREVYGCC